MQASDGLHFFIPGFILSSSPDGRKRSITSMQEKNNDKNRE